MITMLYLQVVFFMFYAKTWCQIYSIYTSVCKCVSGWLCVCVCACVPVEYNAWVTASVSTRGDDECCPMMLQTLLRFMNVSFNSFVFLKTQQQFSNVMQPTWIDFICALCIGCLSKQGIFFCCWVISVPWNPSHIYKYIYILMLAIDVLC